VKEVDQSGRQRRKREEKPNDDKRQPENPSRIKKFENFIDTYLNMYQQNISLIHI
jgi:hypothetical protein